MPKLIGKECCCRLHPAILTSALIDAPPRIKSYFKEYEGLMLLPPLLSRSDCSPHGSYLVSRASESVSARVPSCEDRQGARCEPSHSPRTKSS
jgi:hypothetical protein